MESKRRFGDRKDGRLIQSLAPFYKFMPYIMPTKNDACNQFEDCIEITNTDRWLRQKRLEGYKGLGYLHLFIAAYIRMVSMRPGINRFVAGRRIYARNNIEVVLTVRRSMSTTSNETTIKAVFAPTDTIFDVYRKMNEIPYEWGTAVNVQQMAFGNSGDRSGTGVAFTRDPATGAKKLMGEYLINAQGEDVVAGIRTPVSYTHLTLPTT